MIEHFIPHKQALELKELGFDEECFGFYNKSDENFPDLIIHQNDKYKPWEKESELNVKAPVYQQAFKWFREKYHLIGCVDFHASWKSYMYTIKEFEYITHQTRFETYEEAELECLKKLIEIAKLKK